MKKYDTIIFDLDGTLLNTLDDLADSVNYALKLNNFPCRKIDEVRCFVGNGVGRLMKLSVPDECSNEQYEKCLLDFRTHYSANMQNKTCAYDGIMELLKKLYNKNYKMAIVSNKFDEAVKALNKVYFQEYVKVAIGESENISKKPAPDTVFKALKELGSKAESALYVGDSEVDIMTAKNSSVKCISVTWGFRDMDTLKQYGANLIIHAPNELLSIVE